MHKINATNQTDTINMVAFSLVLFVDIIICMCINGGQMIKCHKQ